MRVVDKMKSQAEKVAKKVAQKMPSAETIQAMNQIWKRQTLVELMGGHLIIPDTLVNSMLRQKVQGFKSINITTMPGQRLEIEAEKSQGNVTQVSATIKALVHNSEKSQMILHVEELKLKDEKILSFLLKWVSVGFLAEFFPVLDEEGIKLSFEGNLVTIDFREKLYASALQRIGKSGKTVIDLVEILDIATRQGESHITLKMHLDEGLQRGLKLLKEKMK